MLQHIPTDYSLAIVVKKIQVYWFEREVSLGKES